MTSGLCSRPRRVAAPLRLAVGILILLTLSVAATEQPRGDEEKLVAVTQDSAVGTSRAAVQEPVVEENWHLDQPIFPNNHEAEPIALLEDFDTTLVTWPFGKKNKTHEDKSCASHKNCYECTTSSVFCHWCGHDQACHARGSVHGCAWGSDCANHTQPKPHKKDKNETACSSHKSCSECALSSTLCHWCAHDQACHAVGSVYGCLSGVNCYSNNRCKRTEPERITNLVFVQMGVLPVVVIFVVGLLCCCCSTMGYCVAGGVKGAYDDLASISAQPMRSQFISTLPPSVMVTHSQPRSTRDEEAAAQNEGDEHDETAALVPSNEEQEARQDMYDGYSLMPAESIGAPVRARSRYMQCLFHCCTACYVLCLLVIGSFVIGSIRYFPKLPVYNVCNDDLAWKSLVDSITAMKVEAQFEALVSVMNPNHFDVDLDIGHGTFKHDGVFIGSFDIPPTQIKAMSITDLTLVTTFAPEKWEALSLTAEYYRGTLVLAIDTQLYVRISGLFDYSFEADSKNVMVHVNDPTLYDRHLCACPDWNDVKNHSSDFLVY